MRAQLHTVCATSARWFLVKWLAPNTSCSMLIRTSDYVLGIEVAPMSSVTHSGQTGGAAEARFM
jgi:hypothetical protein